MLLSGKALLDHYVDYIESQFISAGFTVSGISPAVYLLDSEEGRAEVYEILIIRSSTCFSTV